MQTIYLYLLTVPVFFGIDMIWLSLISRKFYAEQMGSYLRTQPNWFAAILFYLVYIVGILVFAVLPNLDKGPLRVLATGAFLGFIAYATYDLTNYAVLNNWPLNLTIVDLLWGTVLTGTVSVISYYIATTFIFK